MIQVDKSNTERWFGKYLGVDFEINHCKTKGLSLINDKDCWTYYIILRLNRIPDKKISDKLWIKSKPDAKGRVFYSYMENDIIKSIDFHAGCTWYSKEGGFDGANKIIKIGCDHQHYWDEEHIYNLSTIQKDVTIAIDSFKEIVPDYKYWCSGNGNLYDLKDGALVNGTFTSNEYMELKC